MSIDAKRITLNPERPERGNGGPGESPPIPAAPCPRGRYTNHGHTINSPADLSMYTLVKKRERQRGARP